MQKHFLVTSPSGLPAPSRPYCLTAHSAMNASMDQFTGEWCSSVTLTHEALGDTPDLNYDTLPMLQVLHLCFICNISLNLPNTLKKKHYLHFISE